MRVVVDIPSELVDQIRTAIREGDYRDPEEFLHRALRTQLELEMGQQETIPSFGDAIADDRSLKRSSSDFREEVSKSSTPSEYRGNLEDLSSREFDVTTVDPPSSDRIDRGPLWGQYNRIFPMKFSLRRLATVLDDTEADRAPYEQFREETALSARNYGFRLVEIDDKKERKRGVKLSAAFPTGDKIDRSLARYKTHFVGQIDSNNNLTGSLPNLRLVNIDPETRDFGLTEAGLDFARIENPVLDDDIASDSSLSDEERRFYLDHVAEEHPAENEAMHVVAEAIAKGINRPDPLSERVGELSDDWTDAKASTIRSGLVGRLHELGLVSRERVGSRGVKYELTDRGKQELL